MADARPAGGPTRQEQGNEARLRAARREAPPGGDQQAQLGPSESDRAAAWAREQRTARASDEAAQQNIERRQGITQRAGVQIDRKRTEYVPETQVGNMTISRGRQVTEREEMGAGAGRGPRREQGLENKLSRARKPGNPPGAAGKMVGAAEKGLAAASKASSAAKATPVGLAINAGIQGAEQGLQAAKAGFGVLTSQEGSHEAAKAMIGRGCVKGLWSFLWPSFGHTIYPIAVMYLLAGHSRYARRYLPELGDTWIPPEMLKYIPKPLRIPVKLGELLAIMFILFWVLMLDLACAGLLALILGVIISAKDFVS